MSSIDKIKVTELFKDKKAYEIPIYQRNYSWEYKQIKALVDDICGIKNKEYCLGTLIVNENQDRYQVVDGQQRLTTLFLLLAYINNKDEQNLEKKYNLEKELLFEVREESNYLLKEFKNGYKNNDFGENKKNKNIDNENAINKGYRNIEDIIKEKNSSLDDLKSNLEKVYILRVPVPRNVDLNHYFEVMNTRGEQLEQHQIAKNKFIEIFQEDSIYSAIVSMIWDSCFDMSSYIQSSFVNEIRSILFGTDWNTFDFGGLDEIISKIKKELENGDINSKINTNLKGRFSLKRILNGEFKEDYKELYNEEYKEDLKQDNKKNNEEDKNRFESIIDFPNFLLQVNYLMLSEEQKVDKEKLLDDKELVGNLEWIYADKSEEKAREFIFNLLKYRFYFDKYIVKRDNNPKTQKDSEWSIQEYKKSPNSGTVEYIQTEDIKDNKLLKILQASLRITYTSPKTMYWINKVFEKIGEPDELQNELEKYCCNELRDIRQKINDSDNPYGIGFDIPRIVFTYLDYVLYRDGKITKEMLPKDIATKEYDYDIKFRTSIEHFYPQNPDSKIEMDRKYLDNFGNLALITVSGNARVSNLNPDAKYDQWQKDIILQSPKFILMGEEIKKMKEEKSELSLDDYKKCIDNHNIEMNKILDKELFPNT